MLVENWLVYGLTFCVERYNIFLNGREEHSNMFSEHKYTMRNFPLKHIFLVYLYFPLLWIINASKEAE